MDIRRVNTEVRLVGFHPLHFHHFFRISFYYYSGTKMGVFSGDNWPTPTNWFSRRKPERSTKKMLSSMLRNPKATTKGITISNLMKWYMLWDVSKNTWQNCILKWQISWVAFWNAETFGRMTFSKVAFSNVSKLNDTQQNGGIRQWFLAEWRSAMWHSVALLLEELHSEEEHSAE
jgi:hypothetical protein